VTTALWAGLCSTLLFGCAFGLVWLRLYLLQEEVHVLAEALRQLQAQADQWHRH
jgi:hypothetical protein